jgi:alkylresorcinol/alkylpyrone synthase
LERELGLSPTDLSAGRAVLKRAGNLSSPAVLFTLAESLKRRAPRPGEWAFMGSFGAGFSAHAALLRFP